MNFPIQSGAGGILKRAMAELGDMYRSYQADGRIVRPLLQVHDELVFEVEEQLVSEVVPAVIAVMQSAVQLDVPVLVDAEVGDNWKEGEEWAPPAPATEEEADE